MRSIEVELYLSIGLVHDQEETIIVTEEDVNLDDEKELEEYLNEYVEDWKNNYLEYGFTIRKRD